MSLVVVSKFNFENMLKSVQRYKVAHMTYVQIFHCPVGLCTDFPLRAAASSRPWSSCSASTRP